MPVARLGKHHVDPLALLVYLVLDALARAQMVGEDLFATGGGLEALDDAAIGAPDARTLRVDARVNRATHACA